MGGHEALVAAMGLNKLLDDIIHVEDRRRWSQILINERSPIMYNPWLNQLKWQPLLLMHEFKEIRSHYLTCALK